MRLIDADALADALFEKRKNYPQWVAETIGNMPEAVVWCKGCKYAGRLNDEIGATECIIDGTWHDWYWFCADGERGSDG